MNEHANSSGLHVKVHDASIVALWPLVLISGCHLSGVLACI